jgi:ATP-dependent protease HslVU (ClpYQ) ATPase subunit
MLNQRSLRSFKRCESFVQLSTRSLSYSSIEGSSGTVTNTGERRVTRDLIPEEIVKELNKHVIGQEEAKKAVAIALRNRWRRRQLKDDLLSKEISPMNILMSGPTGSGKTEIARRLAKISHSPFLKVEATKFTEIGIYGSNTDSMIKDLTDVAVEMERERAQQENAQAAKERALERLVDLLVIKDTETRAQIKQQIAKGELNERKVFVQLKPKRLQRRPHNVSMIPKSSRLSILSPSDSCRQNTSNSSLLAYWNGEYDD